MSTYRIELDAPEVPYPGGTSQAQFMREAAKRVKGHYAMGSNLTATVVDLLERVAEAMERQAPRIPEPGTWGVVEASLEADPLRRRSHYVRDYGGLWRNLHGAQSVWSGLVDPVLVREGVE